jgi:hypothetical protein
MSTQYHALPGREQNPNLSIMIPKGAHDAREKEIAIVHNKVLVEWQKMVYGVGLPADSEMWWAILGRRRIWGL